MSLEIFVAVLVIALILFGLWVLGSRYFFVEEQRKHLDKLAQKLLFLQVKLPQKLGDMDQKNDNIQSMKQNIEIMNQIYKNFTSIQSGGANEKKYGQPRVSLELLVEKEIIKFILAIPEDSVETLEKIMSSFYPWAVIDYIEQPKLLEAGKYVAWGTFTLQKANAFPLKTYESFEADPMDSIMSAFSRVNTDEKLCLQILASPLWEKDQETLRKEADKIKEGKKEKGFWDGIWSALVSGMSEKKKEDKPEEKKSKFSGQQIQDIDKKGEDELFSVVIRALATSPFSDRPEKIINDLARSVSQYSYVWLNALNYKKAPNLQEFIKELVKRTFYIGGKNDYLSTVVKKTILNIKEISSLFHLPHSRYNKNPRIRRQNYKILPAPDFIPNDWVLLGHNLFGGVKKEIKMKPDDRFRHFYIIGQTGTGKSTMLLVQAKQDLVEWRGFCLLDPHGDLCESLLQYYPKDRIDDLIYFDAANFDYPIGFNVFEASNDDERNIITDDLVDMFIQMYGHEIFGPRIQDYFRNAALALMEQPDGGTLTEIVRMFVDPAFQKIKLQNVKNPVVRAWREKTYGSMGDREKQEMVPYFQAKFGPFTTTVIIRNIIGQPKSAFNIGQAMQQWKVILVNLSKGKLGDINSQLIGRMVVTQIKLAAMARAKMDNSERVPFYLYIDEFQNYVSSSIESILSEARKYKLGLVVAHQYIDQLKQSGLGGWLDLSKAIFGNVGTMMAYKVGAPDAEFLEKEFSPEISQNDLVNMDKFKGIMKLSIDSQPTRPFSISPLNPYTPPTNPAEKVAIIKQISALKWGTKRELAEKEIYFRVGI